MTGMVILVIVLAGVSLVEFLIIRKFTRCFSLIKNWRPMYSMMSEADKVLLRKKLTKED